LGPGRHFLWRMDFSNVFVEFSTGFWTYQLLLFWLLCFLVFLLFEFANDATKLSSIPQNMRGKKNFLTITFLVDVTLAVCKLSQKPCSNVNISASAVPKRFLARAKIPIIPVQPPLREMFFPLPNFLRTQGTSWSKYKHSCNVHCLKSYPGMLTLLVMSHEHWPHANFTRFQKNNLGYFG